MHVRKEHPSFVCSSKVLVELPTLQLSITGLGIFVPPLPGYNPLWYIRGNIGAAYRLPLENETVLKGDSQTTQMNIKKHSYVAQSFLHSVAHIFFLIFVDGFVGRQITRQSAAGALFNWHLNLYAHSNRRYFKHYA